MRQIVLFGLLVFGSMVHASQSRCAFFLGAAVEFETHEEDFLLANGVGITGDFIYPLKMVLADLDIADVRVRTRYKDKKVLTIGEGVSRFLPYLLDKGVAAQGLDIWYGQTDFPDNFSGRLMRDYVKKYGPHLVGGDATKLPYGDQSLDRIFSHLLVNNLEEPTQMAMLKEIVRVLTAGGQARVFGFGDEQIEPVKEFLKEKFGSQLRLESKAITYRLNFQDNRASRQKHLLIIKKSRKGR